LQGKIQVCPQTAGITIRLHKATRPCVTYFLHNDYDFSEYIEDQIINKRRSPGAALAQIKIDGKEFKTHICETTLYNWIYKGVFLNLSDQDLLYKGKRRNEGKREQKTEGWARPPKGDTIEHRPEEVNNRDTFGNWEMDSVIGCKGSKAALVVLTERLTRYPMLNDFHQVLKSLIPRDPL
jgi:IS30 family transposase